MEQGIDSELRRKKLLTQMREQAVADEAFVSALRKVFELAEQINNVRREFQRSHDGSLYAQFANAKLYGYAVHVLDCSSFITPEVLAEWPELAEEVKQKKAAAAK